MYLIVCYAIFAVFCGIFLLAYYLDIRHRFKRKKKSVEDLKAQIRSEIQQDLNESIFQ